MSTHYFIVVLTISLLLGCTNVQAGGYSMHTGDIDSIRVGGDDNSRVDGDVRTSNGSSAVSQREEIRAGRITPSGRSYGANADALNTIVAEDDSTQPASMLGDVPTAVRATQPGAGNTGSQKARAGNRWQSLVPGAIK